MLNLRRSMLPALVVVCLVASAAVSHGQEADADKAKSLLRKGIAQFNALSFKEAKATLLAVNQDDLSDADKGVLDEYITAKLDPAIREQMAAMAAYKEAEKAAEAGDLAKAKGGFETAAASEYLPAAMRQDAEAQLAVVAQKLVVADAAAKAAKSKASPTTKPAQPVEGPDEKKPAERAAKALQNSRPKSLPRRLLNSRLSSPLPSRPTGPPVRRRQPRSRHPARRKRPRKCWPTSSIGSRKRKS